jgi:single-stranded-DNA-specific exonuclease
MLKIKRRTWSEETIQALSNTTLHAVLKRIYASRGVSTSSELSYELSQLASYHGLLNCEKAAAFLGQALKAQKSFLIVGDFDADGATATTIAVKALRLLGAKKVDFLVPNRFEYGYGLTPGIVDEAAKQKPDILITVDNGISSLDGVARASEYGIDVVVTDHHLAGEVLPEAAVIVNPNQPEDTFPSKSMAGVGVIFYVMLALRAYLKEQGWFEQQGITEPNMGSLLDIVALGTVADVVPLDYNNRVLVHNGLKRIQMGKCCEGILALLRVAKRDLEQLTTADLAFAVAPRLNAAGRLDDMSLGIQCLLSEDAETAGNYAQELDALNLERRDIEQEMQQQALKLMDTIALDPRYLPDGICLYEPSWHQGVIGILAGRMKDKFHRPVIAFADSTQNDELKGSARSISGIHIRDSLDAIAKRHPELLEKFGGHAMAAGLSIKKSNFSAFQKVFREQITADLKEEQPRAELWTDGTLSPDDFNLDFALLLRNSGPWGQHFPEPLFDNIFTLHNHFLLKGKHLKMCLGYENHPLAIDAIAFNVDEKFWPNPRCKKVYAVYKLDVNIYQGRRTVQLLVEHLQPA